MMTGNIRMLGRHINSRGNGLLARPVIERKRFDGRVRSFASEIYNPDDGAANLVYDPSRSRAFRVRLLPARCFEREL
jgi:hypothetical protein